MCGHVIDIEITNRESLKLFFLIIFYKDYYRIKLKEHILSIFSCMLNLDNFANISLLKMDDLFSY